MLINARITADDVAGVLKLVLQPKSWYWLYLLGVWLDHDVTIDENGTNDGEGK
jgi:hypothetical protein